MLRTAVPVLPPVPAAVSLRGQEPRGVADGGRRGWDPHFGQTLRGRVPFAEQAPAAAPRIPKPGGGDPDHGEEVRGTGLVWFKWDHDNVTRVRLHIWWFKDTLTHRICSPEKKCISMLPFSVWFVEHFPDKDCCRDDTVRDTVM